MIRRLTFALVGSALFLLGLAGAAPSPTDSTADAAPTAKARFIKVLTSARRSPAAKAPSGSLRAFAVPGTPVKPRR